MTMKRAPEPRLRARHALWGAVLLAGCGGIETVGKAPAFTPVSATDGYAALYAAGLPEMTMAQRPVDDASLWAGGRGSLLGDRRAGQRGDILTVVIEIDDSASISNRSARGRDGSTSAGMPQMLGLPQRLDAGLPEGATMANAFSLKGQTDFAGSGSAQRSEKLTLRIAASVVETLPNGVLRIEGTQEVRVNFELRELVVTGFVRPQDISRLNEITYDKIAGARIGYGGRGQITDMQQPRIGQQVADAILPF